MLFSTIILKDVLIIEHFLCFLDLAFEKCVTLDNGCCG